MTDPTDRRIAERRKLKLEHGCWNSRMGAPKGRVCIDERRPDSDRRRAPQPRGYPTDRPCERCHQTGRVFDVGDGDICVECINQQSRFVSALPAAPTPVQPAGAPEPIVEWVEPFGPHDEPVTMRVPASTAIAVMLDIARKKGKCYDSPEKALDDFVVVHWATLLAAASVPVQPVTPAEWSEVVNAVHFFASVIKSGERWSVDCELTVKRVRELDRLRTAPAREGK